MPTKSHRRAPRPHRTRARSAAAFVVASDVFFLVFLAALLAVLLRGAADALARRTGLGRGRALALVVAAAAIAAAGLYALGASVAGQFGQLAEELPRALDHSRDYLERHEWGRRVLDRLPSGGAKLTGRLVSLFSTTFGALGNLVLLTFLALYLAAEAGVLFGVLGLIAASPLVVAVLVAVKMLYVEDVLGDRLDVPGAPDRPDRGSMFCFSTTGAGSRGR